ncbi:MAG: hypothetical protein JW703_02910 [Candidatus Diapherotrites archaeon]|nr:hypothetical protein [Candidatus Diapherotrites archaeon]
MKKLFLIGLFLIFVFGCIQEGTPIQNELITCADGSVVNSVQECVPVQQSLECNDKCSDTTRLTQGHEVNGECVYDSKKDNAIECGFIPGISNPCENISCENKCSGTTWLANGSCSEGNCNYSTELTDSVKCKYDFNVFLQDCYYLGSPDNEFGIVFTIRNLGTKETNRKESIWLKGTDGTVYSYYYLNNNYGKGRVLFDTIQWTSSIFTWRGDPKKGQLWTIKNLESGLKEENNKEFQLIYCPKETDSKLGDCDESNGLILYEGNTHSCLKELHEEKYFPPSCTSDYCINVGEFIYHKVTDETANEYLTQNPTGYAQDMLWFVRMDDDLTGCAGVQGCYGKDVLVFKAKKIGKTTITIPKCKVWDCENTTKTETITVEVKE